MSEDTFIDEDTSSPIARGDEDSFPHTRAKSVPPEQLGAFWQKEYEDLHEIYTDYCTGNESKIRELLETKRNYDQLQTILSSQGITGDVNTLRREIGYLRQNRDDLAVAQSLSVNDTQCEMEKQSLEKKFNRLKKMHRELQERAKQLDELLNQCNQQTKNNIIDLKNNEIHHHIMLQKIEGMLGCTVKRNALVTESILIQNPDGTHQQVTRFSEEGRKALGDALLRYANAFNNGDPLPSNLCDSQL